MGFENFNPIKNTEKNILDKIPDHYNDRGEELDLDTVLEAMKAITAEWQKEDKDEGVRSKEISLALRLPKIQIPEDKKEEFLKVAQEFIEWADEQACFFVKKVINALEQGKDPIEAIKIKKTKEFRQAIKDDFPLYAESVLSYIKNNREEFNQYDDRWVDLQELELFRYYRKKKMWDEANRVIESMQESEHNKKNNSRQGRIDVLSREMEI